MYYSLSKKVTAFIIFIENVKKIDAIQVKVLLNLKDTLIVKIYCKITFTILLMVKFTAK